MKTETPVNSDNELIRSILERLIYKDAGEIDITKHAFDEIDVFVDRYFNVDFAQVIIDSLDSDTDLRKIARMFDILIWSTPDNGKKLDQLINNWIISDDKRKVQIILFREDSFPGQSAEENRNILSKVKIKFPDLADICDYHIREFEYWDKKGFRQMDEFYKIVNKLR